MADVDVTIENPEELPAPPPEPTQTTVDLQTQLVDSKIALLEERITSEMQRIREDLWSNTISSEGTEELKAKVASLEERLDETEAIALAAAELASEEPEVPEPVEPIPTLPEKPAPGARTAGKHWSKR